MLKYADLDLLEAGRASPFFRKSAHRADFSHIPRREGYLYVRSRAISSRTNENFDHFGAKEIKKAYQTFIGKPVFINHRNDNHRRARGCIVDAALHEDINPDGSPDTWVEVLMEVDAIRFPTLAKAILDGDVDRTSMGADVEFSLCSVCGNKARSPMEYCSHIRRSKGREFIKASGEKIVAYEECYGLSFFENSILVEDPADPTAFFLGVEGDLVSTAARDESYPERRSPGVHAPFGEWGIGPYHQSCECGESFEGQTYEEAEDKLIEHLRSVGVTSKLATVSNTPCAWCKLPLKDHTAMRLAKCMQMLREMRLGASKDDEEAWDEEAWDEGTWDEAMTDEEEEQLWKERKDRERQREWQRERTRKMRSNPDSPFHRGGAKSNPYVQTDKGDQIHKSDAAAEMYGVGSPEHQKAIKRFGPGTVAASQRPVSDLDHQGYQEYLDGLAEGEAPLSFTQWMRFLTSEAAKASSTCPSCGSTDTGPSPNRMSEVGDDANICHNCDAEWSGVDDVRCKHCGYEIHLDGSGRWEHSETGSKHCFAPGGGKQHDEAVAIPEVYGSKRADTYKERVTTPPDVDTMREEECPVCGGDASTFDGARCDNCGYLVPPDFLQDPEVDVAGEIDDAQDDQAFEDAIDGEDPTTVINPDEVVEEEDEAFEDVVEEEVEEELDPENPKAESGPKLDEKAKGVEEEKAPLEPKAKEPKAKGEHEFPSADEDEKRRKKKRPKESTMAARQLEALTKAHQEITRLQGITRRQASQIGRLNRNRKSADRRFLVMEQVIEAVAAKSGIDRPSLAGIVRQAVAKTSDEKNPAQPVAEPSAGAPPGGTTEDAKAVDGTVPDPNTPGAADGLPDPEAGASKVDVEAPGEALPEPLEPETEVTTPVAGTQEVDPAAKIDVDVKTLKNPDESVASPLEPAFKTTTTRARPMACLRLARLRIATGVEQAGEDADLTIGAAIEASRMTDAQISQEIATLERVRQARQNPPAQRGRVAPQGAPRIARRVSPSLASQEPSEPIISVASSEGDDSFLFE